MKTSAKLTLLFILFLYLGVGAYADYHAMTTLKTTLLMGLLIGTVVYTVLLAYFYASKLTIVPVTGKNSWTVETLSYLLGWLEACYKKVPSLSRKQVEADGGVWEEPYEYYFISDNSPRLRQRLRAVLFSDPSSVSYWRKREELRLQHINDTPAMRESSLYGKEYWGKLAENQPSA